jgi:hypothetical protein
MSPSLSSLSGVLKYTKEALFRKMDVFPPSGGSVGDAYYVCSVRVIYFTACGLPPISSSWRQASWHSRPVILFFQLNTYSQCPYVTSSLTRGWACYLQFLLVLASAVILRSESRRTNDYILLSQIRGFPQPGGPRPRIYISQEQGELLTPSATGFPFRRLLRLTGLPPHCKCLFKLTAI